MPDAPMLLTFAADVEWPDTDAADAMRVQVPADGSWGRLADHAEWLAAAQGQCPPHPFARVRLLRFGAPAAADDAADGRLAGIRDVPHIAIESVEAAVAAGAAIADDEIDRGADLLIVALPGLGTGAAALVSLLTDTEPVKLVPRGYAVTADEWSAQVVAIRDARRRAAPDRAVVTDLLTALFDEIDVPDLVALAGFLLRCATRRTPVVYDGVAAACAAIVGYEVQARAGRWWRPADVSTHPVHPIALARMAQQPVLELGTGLGDGAVGVLAADVFREAVRVAGAALGPGEQPAG